MEKLSKRENEVLKLMSKGRSNLEIANELKIAMTTVKTHIQTIYDKLYLTNSIHEKSALRVRAVLYYLKQINEI